MKFGLVGVKPVLKAIHWSQLRGHVSGTVRDVSGITVDYLSRLPDDVGMYSNSKFGDCFWAAATHLADVHRYWTTGTFTTQPDSVPLDAYAAAMGFDPSQTQPDGSNPTDQGTDPQRGFDYLIRNGLSGDACEFPPIEIDPRNFDDVLRAMDECGGLMVGMSVPTDVNDTASVPWAATTSNDEGHEVFFGKGDSNSDLLGFISWGNPRFQMTKECWLANVNQCTAYVDADWIAATGKTPFGLSIDQLRQIAAAWGTAIS
jgi:hypothetical protein